MDNGQNQNTGSKGVFPGSIPNAQPQPQVNTAGAVNQSPVEQVVQNMQPVESNTTQNQTKTYIRLETKNINGQTSGILEIDLISFRERGVESRYLSINAVGSGQNGAQSDTVLSIDNEADFNKFKKFISELNWND